MHYKCDICEQDKDEKELVVLNGQKICHDCLKDVYFTAAREQLIKANSGDEEASRRYNNLMGFQNGVNKDLDNAVMSDTDNEEEEYMQQMKAVLDQMASTLSENSPAVLKAHLDKYVIGQEEAKKALCLAVYNHYKRAMFHIAATTGQVDLSDESTPDELLKSNVLLCGPSGVGKTYILRTLAKKMGIPFAVCDASTYTANGFVGQDPQSCLKTLYDAADGDMIKAQYGMIFLDEFDKLSAPEGDNAHITSDPAHVSVQQELLKLIEGGECRFTPNGQRMHPDATTLVMDTTNILFVCGGAFDGIDKIIDKRIGKGSVGFTTHTKKDSGINTTGMDEGEKYNALIDRITAEDFKKYGIITEMLGRLPNIVKLHQLNVDELYRILMEPKNAVVKQYKLQAKMIDHIDLIFTEDALRAVAKKVIEHKTGARGLRTVIEQKLSSTLYAAINKSVEGGRKLNMSITVNEKCINEDDIFPIISVAE